jgi:serine/threonine protein kinase
MRKVDVKRRNQVAHTMAERRIMASVRHPFVVPLLCAFQTSEKLYMVRVRLQRVAREGVVKKEEEGSVKFVKCAFFLFAVTLDFVFMASVL